MEVLEILQILDWVIKNKQHLPVFIIILVLVLPILVFLAIKITRRLYKKLKHKGDLQLQVSGKNSTNFQSHRDINIGSFSAKKGAPDE